MRASRFYQIRLSDQACRGSSFKVRVPAELQAAIFNNTDAALLRLSDGDLAKLVETNFSRVSGEFRKRLLLVGITRATRWAYLSTVGGWEMGEVGLLHSAAGNGDLFVKTGNAADHLTPIPPAQDESDDNNVGFL